MQLMTPSKRPIASLHSPGIQVICCVYVLDVICDGVRANVKSKWLLLLHPPPTIIDQLLGRPPPLLPPPARQKPAPLRRGGRAIQGDSKCIRNPKRPPRASLVRAYTRMLSHTHTHSHTHTPTHTLKHTGMIPTEKPY